MQNQISQNYARLLQARIASNCRAIAFDRTFYMVFCRASDGEVYAAERTFKDMNEAEIVKDIAQGQVENVLAVFEFNPSEHTSRDISEDIAYAVKARCWADYGAVTKSAQSFVETHITSLD